MAKKLGLGPVGKAPGFGLGLHPPGPGALAPSPHPLGGLDFSPGSAEATAEKFRPVNGLVLAKRVLEHNPNPKKFGGKKGM